MWHASAVMVSFVHISFAVKGSKSAAPCERPRTLS